MLLVLSALALAGTNLERPPAALELDGELSEWQAAPTVMLDRTSQIGGRDRVQNGRDMQAEVWLAFDAEGLVIAGRIRDDVDWTARPDSDFLRSDHLRVRLAIDEPDLPEIGFGNQFGNFTVHDATDCHQSDVHDAAACVQWLEETHAYRRELAARFQVDVVFSAQHARRVTRSAVGTTGPAVAMKRTAGGYTFEARLESMPLVRREEIDRLHVLIDAVDNDNGQARRETILSSSATALVSDPSTWPVYEVAEPESVVSLRPSILPGLLEKGYALQLGLPGLEATHALWFENVPVGYQYTPEEQSPALFEIPLGDGRELPHVGQGLVLEMDFGDLGNRLFYLKGEGVASMTSTGCAVEPVALAGETFFLSRCETLHSPYGSGMCGACPAYDWSVTALRDDVFVAIAGGFFSSAPYGDGISFGSSADGSTIGFRSVQYDDETDEESWNVEVYQFSEKTRTFEPVDPEGVEINWSE